MPLTVGDHRRNAYLVVVLSDNDLYVQGEDEVYTREEALAVIRATEDKCYLIAVEYDGGGVYRIKAEPHT